MGRTKNNKSLNHAGSLEKREAILAALAKANADSSSSNGLAGEPDDEIEGYYTLTLEEMTALVTGDMEKIGSWMSHLDRPQATWLLGCLIKER